MCAMKMVSVRMESVHVQMVSRGATAPRKQTPAALVAPFWMASVSAQSDMAGQIVLRLSARVPAQATASAGLKAVLVSRDFLVVTAATTPSSLVGPMHQLATCCTIPHLMPPTLR